MQNWSSLPNFSLPSVQIHQSTTMSTRAREQMGGRQAERYVYVCMYVCMYGNFYIEFFLLYRMHRWGLSQSADCLACHSSTPDTIDHVYGDCPIWRDVLQRALSFLHMLHISVNVTTQSDVIGLLLSTGSLRVYFLLLLTSFWQKREKLPPSAIFASFKWTFKQYIKISWYSTRVQRVSFSQQWSPFARVRDSIVFHHLL